MFKNKLFKKKDIKSIKSRMTKEVEGLIKDYYDDLDNNALKYEIVNNKYIEVKERLEKELEDLKNNTGITFYKIRDENSLTRTELDKALTFKNNIHKLFI